MTPFFSFVILRHGIFVGSLFSFYLETENVMVAHTNIPLFSARIQIFFGFVCVSAVSL